MSWKRIYSDALKSNQKNIEGVSESVIGRFSWRGNNKRIWGDIYEEIRIVLRYFLEMIKVSVTRTKHARRKSVTTLDIIFGFQKR
jgi:histone H4